MNHRYYALDVFRGATVALMILVNNPGSWDHIFSPLAHAHWHGLTPTDLVFPFFLFAVGNALSFVMPTFENAGPAFFWKKILKRTVLIFAIGLVLNWSPFIKWDGDILVVKSLENIRIMGVLQRIALCYCLAAIIIFYGKSKGAFFIGMLLLLLYWFICLLLGSSGDPFSLQGWFGTAMDLRFFGVAHIYKGEGIAFDPEGLMSTPAAIVQVIFGFLVGEYIQLKGKNFDMLANLLIAGIVLMITGYCWGLVFPINKKIWTSSFTIYTTGLAILSLGLLIYTIEFKHCRNKCTRFFDVFGKNPLFIFVLSGLLPRILGLFRWATNTHEDGSVEYISLLTWFYQHICEPIAADPRVGSLVYALALICFYWLIVFFLDKKKLYIKV